jgi:hypothetical protein
MLYIPRDVFGKLNIGEVELLRDIHTRREVPNSLERVDRWTIICKVAKELR